MSKKPQLTIATGPLLPVPALNGGSVHRMWELLAPELAAHWEVCVAARAWHGQPAAEMIRGVRYQRWGGFTHSRHLVLNLLRDARYAYGLSRRLPSADFLIVNDVMLPLFAQSHSGRMLISVNRYPKGQLRLWRRAAYLIAPSMAIATAIGQQSPELAKRTILIPNALALADFRPPETTPRTPDSIVYVGRLHPEKGIETLLAAARMLQQNGKRMRLTIVGPHEIAQGGAGPDYLDQLRACCTGMTVEFTGAIFDRKQLAEHYHRHALFCYPSIAETGEAAPVAPLEAMAAGCVPVVSNLECYRGVLRDGHNALVYDHRDTSPAAALAALLERACADPGRIRALAQQAAVDVQAFDISAVARRWLELLEQLNRKGEQP